MDKPETSDSSQPDGTNTTNADGTSTLPVINADGTNTLPVTNADGTNRLPATNDVPEDSRSPINILQGFTKRFIWSAPHDVPIQVESFPGDLIAEVQTAVSYAFSHAVQAQPSTVKSASHVEVPTQNSITLYCPHQAGHVVIDSVVKLVATQQQADVLVLDALELAAGKFGALGEGASVIDSVYKAAAEAAEKPKDSKTDPSKASEDNKDKGETNNNSVHNQDAQRFFDALINVPGANEEGRPMEPQPTRRIVYLRDFGSIARAAKPLMAYILQAIHNIHSVDDNRMPRATVMIMGVTKAIGLADNDDSEDEDEDPFLFFMRGRKSSDTARVKRYEALRAGGYKLRQIIPHLGNEFPISGDHASPMLFNGLSAQLFLPLVIKPSKLEYESFSVDPIWGGKVDDLASHGIFLSIFTKDAHSEDSCRAQKDNILERTRAINDTLMRMCLGKRGGLADEKLTSELLVEGNDKKLRDHFQSSILSPSAADAITTTAIGLSCSQPSNTSKSVHVTPSKLMEAYQIYLKNERGRADWVSEEEKNGNEKEDPVVKQVKQDPDLSMHEKGLLSCIVDSRSLSTTFGDVCVDSKVIETLKTVVSLPISYPSYFKTGILAKEAITGVLLYGPPGTGKTMLCRALAHECNARMLHVKPSDILDKYVGENEKNATSLFSLASRLAPCVIFLDEVDSLFGARGGDSGSCSSKWRRDLLTEFMLAMDGLQSASTNKEKGIVVVGASNRPFDIDQAILRRLPCRMMVDIPGKDERQSILKVHLKDETLCDDVDIAQIAYETEGYSGSDLKNLCVSAAMASVKDAIGDWKSRRKDDNTSEETREKDSTATDASQASPPRSISIAHFEHAFAEVTPSFFKDANFDLYRWHKKFSPSVPANMRPRLGKATIGEANATAIRMH